jgi:signal transduction histidine kinase
MTTRRTAHFLAGAAPSGENADHPSDPDHPSDAGPRPGRRRGHGSIARRLAAVLAVPGVAASALLGAAVTDQVADDRAAGQVVRAVNRELAVQDLIHELQRERGLTNGLLGGDTGFRSPMAAERRSVGSARARLDQALATSTDPDAESIRRALVPLAALGTVRDQVDSLTADRSAVFAFYTERITTLNRLDHGIAGANDQQLRRAADSLVALGEAKEATARERGFLNGVLSAGRFRGEEYAQFAGLRAARLAWLDAFDRSATPDQRRSAQDAMGSAAASDALAMEQQALAGASNPRLTVPAPVWWRAMTRVVDDLRGSQVQVGADLTARAEQLSRAAVNRLWLLGGIAAGCLVGGTLTVLAASRSITRPLAALAAVADAAAAVRLPGAVRRLQTADLSGDGTVAGTDDADAGAGPPEPITVPARASSEIRRVATALDRVQTSAYELARQQAVLRRTTTQSLANLGRRNQNLLRRQLGFISGLEREETDPDALANLFELDHLATRMRRNAESLLVLVGETGPRPGTGALSIADVIRAATAEVEEYLRVALRRLDDGTVSGAMVSDLAHLLAELLENGLSFSPPDADVEIHGRWIDSGYLVAVIDHGIGMSPQDLARANARLSGDQTVLTTPTRFLGHAVVSRLARRIGAQVSLTPSPVTGVTARVVLPSGSVVIPPAPTGVPVQVDQPAPPDAPTGGDPPVGADPTDRNSWFATWDAARSVELLRTVDLVDAADRPRTLRPVPSPPDTPAESVPRLIDLTAAERAEPAALPERTRNGLVKRKPRTTTVPTGPPGGPPDRRRADEDGAVGATGPGGDGAGPERTPDAVRSMISALRAGVRRGETRDRTPFDPLPAPDPDDGPRTEEPR